MMRTLQIQELAEVQAGATIRKSRKAGDREQQQEHQREEVQLLQPRDLDDWGNWSGEELERVRLTPKSAQSHLLVPGDVYLQIKGETYSSGQVDDRLAGAILSSNFARIRLHEEGRTKVAPEFLVWYLRHPESRKILRRASRGSTISFLPVDGVREIPIPVPNAETQARVAGLHRDLLEMAVTQSTMIADRISLGDALTWAAVVQEGENRREAEQ